MGKSGQLREESSWLEATGEAIGDAGAAVVNGVASFGDAIIHNPGAVLAGVGGAGLTAVSAADEVEGIALDATGLGAIVGVPLVECPLLGERPVSGS